MRWREVKLPAPLNGEIDQVLASVDALRYAWDEAVNSASPEEFTEARQRSLRRHAIETGIIERLYDVDWGVTEALVAEGLTAEVAAREGGLDDDALSTIRSQFDGLTLLAETAREGRPLTVHFIRELHALICRNQATYEARNDLGQILQVPLLRGAWKVQANHVVRPDGSLLEYAPPEQVDQQVERLVALYQETSSLHPVIRAAWLHHAFICIHPFQDGNGRVARGLTLLVLLQHNYAPLVVDRLSRAEYLASLDAANGDDLRQLVRLFSRLEIVALRSELERPAHPATAGSSALDVAKSYVDRLKSLRSSRDSDRSRRVAALAQSLQQRITVYLTDMSREMEREFRQIDSRAKSWTNSAGPGDDGAGYWRAQIIRVANRADFFVNLSDGTWWSQLGLEVLAQRLRFVAAVQKVGHGETGVLALTVFAEAFPSHDDSAESRPLPVPLLEATEAETATFVYTDVAQDRWDEVASLLDRTFAAAVAQFAQGLD